MLHVSAVDVITAFDDMLTQRPRVAAIKPILSGNPVEFFEASTPAIRLAIPAGLRENVALQEKAKEKERRLAEVLESESESDSEEPKSEPEPEPADFVEENDDDDECKEVTEDMPDQAHTPSGVLLASLQSALRALGYDLERSWNIVGSRLLPDELVACVSASTGGTHAAIRAALLAQCSMLEPRLRESLEQQKAEAKRQRLALEEIMRADQAERASMKEQEEKRKRAMMGAFICGVCNRLGCPVMPIWHVWDEGSVAPAAGFYNGNNGPAVGVGAPTKRP